MCADQTQTTQHEQRTHHPDSASSLTAKEWCEMFEGADSETEASTRGTLCHEAAESGDFSKLNDDEIPAVEMVRNEVDLIRQRLIKEGGAFYEINEEPLLIDDKKHPTGADGTSGGILDNAFVFNNETEAIINDFKFVSWKVKPAQSNLQGIVYLLCLRHRFPTLGKVTVRFLMPYLKAIDEHVFYEHEFEGLYLRVCRAVARRYEKDRRERPSFDCCLYCARIGACKAVARLVKVPVENYADVRAPENLIVHTFTKPEEVLAAIRWYDLCKGHGVAGRKGVTDMVIENPKLLPEEHYNLIDQQSRVITNPKAFEEALLKFISQEQLDAIKKIGLTDATDAVKKSAPRGQKGALAQEFDETLEQLGAVGPGDHKIFLKAKRDREKAK